VKTFDYIIVGAGSASCVLANRLSSQRAVRVALLEAGPSDRSALIRIPAAVGGLLRHPVFNWNFNTVPQRHLDNRVTSIPRGRVLGGTSSINGMVYTRGIRVGLSNDRRRQHQRSRNDGRRKGGRPGVGPTSTDTHAPSGQTR
jgi:choline dehydrogenase-like flavoprotein